MECLSSFPFPEWLLNGRPCDNSYIVAQILGGMLGAFANLTVFRSVFDQFERINDIDRGDSRSLMVSQMTTCV